MDFYESWEEALSHLFLKGYQWPFDARKAAGGSSMIDLLVYRETCVRGRRVWLDYQKIREKLQSGLKACQRKPESIWKIGSLQPDTL